jgi:Arc/MetJ family transcription regulator
MLERFDGTMLVLGRGGKQTAREMLVSRNRESESADLVELTSMRTTIEIDDNLLGLAMQSSGLPSKKAVVEAGLRLLIDVHNQVSIRRHRGKIRWEGDLISSRASRTREPRA